MSRYLVGMLWGVLLGTGGTLVLLGVLAWLHR